MFVCLCKAVSDRRVRELVGSGIRTLQAIEEASGAGTVCGACLPVLAQILEEERGRAEPERT